MWGDSEQHRPPEQQVEGGRDCTPGQQLNISSTGRECEKIIEELRGQKGKPMSSLTIDDLAI